MTITSVHHRPPAAWLAAYVAALLAMGVLDALWLGVLARDFYQQQLGPLMAEPVRWLPALLFYLGYPLGLVGLGLNPLPANTRVAVLRCAAVGLLAYGTYDLSNQATLRGFGPLVAAVDMAWGTVASALAGLLAWRVLRPKA